jgi:hypothetical protein
MNPSFGRPIYPALVAARSRQDKPVILELHPQSEVAELLRKELEQAGPDGQIQKPQGARVGINLGDFASLAARIPWVMPKDKKRFEDALAEPLAKDETFRITVLDDGMNVARVKILPNNVADVQDEKFIEWNEQAMGMFVDFDQFLAEHPDLEDHFNFDVPGPHPAVTGEAGEIFMDWYLKRVGASPEEYNAVMRSLRP